MERIVIDDVFKLLQCDEGGLSEEEATRRYEIFGPNKLETEEQNPILQVGLISPLSPTNSVSSALAVFEFHVESLVMGHGGRRSCRYCPLQRSSHAP